MANITDQFVTSFSELYYSTTKIDAVDTANPTSAEIRTWFENSSVTEKVETLTFDISSVAIGTITLTVNGVVYTADTTSSSSATTITTSFKTAINADNSAVITASGTATLILTGDADSGAGDFTVVFAAGTSAVTASTATIDFVAGTKLIPLVMEIGTLSNEATVIDTPTFGEVYRGKLRGQLDGGQLDAQLYWAPRNAIHQELRELSETGVPVYVGIKWNSDSTASNSEFVYFDSFVSSFGIDTTFDDVAKVSCTFVVDGAEHFASEV